MSFRYFSRHFSCGLLGAVLCAILPADAAFAETPAAQCAREVGGYFNRRTNTWYSTLLKTGTPQEMRFYDCLDRLTNPHMRQQPTTAKRLKTAAQPRRSARAGSKARTRPSPGTSGGTPRTP